MSQKEGHGSKPIPNRSMAPVAQPTREENIPNDPPGVHMPSEREMTPPQFG